LKILHLLNSSQFSGAENMVCQIIHMMEVHPEYEMAYCSRDGQIRQALKERGIKFIPVQNLSSQEIRRVIREYAPDIIHAHDMRASYAAAMACGKLPFVSHIHNNSFASRKISVKAIAYILAARKAKHIFWVSESAFRGYCFQRLVKRKSTVLYNIIDVPALYERMREDSNAYSYDIVFLGRITFPKDPQRLIRVLAQVVQKKPDVRAAVIGSGELEEETIALCHKLRLEENVFFLGFQRNPLKILHDAKLMIMTSRWEGLPMCALEALALGVPVVSTPTDGLKELIEDGKNGFLSEEDTILAERIIQVLIDEELQKGLSSSARENALQFNDTEVYCQELLRAYEI